MRKYRIIYWSNLYKTDWIVGAPNREEAIRRFKRLIGDAEIIQIYEVNGSEHN